MLSVAHLPRFVVINILCYLLLFSLASFLSGCSREWDDRSMVSDLPEQVDFNFHIKPILVQKCYLCHGPDPSSREADLRLDIFEGATAKLESGHQAIVPGKPGKSHLLDRVAHSDPELRMPPAAINQDLTSREIALIKKWISQGAEYQPHWAFVAPDKEKFAKYEGKPTTQVIDELITKKQQETGLTSAPKADRPTLIRRLSYTLTGLPPTPEETINFLSDHSPDAYEKLVEKYLSSKAYGEKWARHWLDVVRYAETRGHEFDYPIQGAWRYRDYLIRAFNQDVPFDQMTREQLAGDLLPNPRINPVDNSNESVLGTLFYTLGEGTHSPVDTRKDESDRIDNMIDVTSKAFQALTVACAKCHDHKFDPIPTADYYALYGIMEGTRFSPVPAKQYTDQKIALEEAQELQAYIRRQFANSWQSKQAETIPFQLTSMVETDYKSLGIKVIGDFRGQDFSGWKSDGKAFGPKTTLGNPVFSPSGNALARLEEGMASSRYFDTGIFGVLRSPDFIIDSQYLGVKARGSQGTIRVVMDNFQLIQYPIYGDMSQPVQSSGWKEMVFDVGQWKGHKAYLEVLPGKFQNHHYVQNDADYVEILYAIAYDDVWQEPTLSRSNGSSMPSLVEKWKSFQSSPDEVQMLNRWIAHQPKANNLEGLPEWLSKWKNLNSSMKDSVYFSGVTEGFKMESPVFIRGNHLELSSEKVPRRFLPEITYSNPIFESPGSGRMEMVEAILSPQNPLTARVMANRIWHHLFGRGIVETVDNFGLQGKLPTDPELLDYLAVTFVKKDWSIKELIRDIVLTDAFQLSTQPDETARQKDPQNLYLSHFPIRRLDAEAIRDGLLAVAGNLDTTSFGKPVPVHLTSFMQGRGRPSNSGPIDGDGRRSVYVEVRRNFLSHVLQTFDFPTPFTAFGKRDVTNVPAQSLMLMNDPFVIHQAEVLAEVLLQEKNQSLSERFDGLYLRTFSRKPTEHELEQASKLIWDWAAREGVSEERELMSHQGIWKDYCHTLFNLKEFIYLM